MRVTTFFFTGTGNTWWAAREFSSMLSLMGHDARLYSLEQLHETDSATLRRLLYESDAVGFAFPIHGASMPAAMRRFVLRCAAARAGAASATLKRTFNICTVASVNALGPVAAGRFFRSKGFGLVASVNVRLTNNASVPGLRLNPVGQDVLARRMDTARSVLRACAEALVAGRRHVRGTGPHLLPGMLIWKLLGRKLADSHKILSVDLSRCSRCMTCVRRCPTRSILYEEEHFVFQPSCSTCMRCYNGCPQAAILHKGRFADPAIYRRYPGPQEEWFEAMQKAVRAVPP